MKYYNISTKKIVLGVLNSFSILRIFIFLAPSNHEISDNSDKAAKKRAKNRLWYSYVAIL